jgi:peroxiredoxin
MPLALLVALSAFQAALPFPDFEIGDGSGSRLSAYADHRATVLVFLAVDCPLANLYAPRLGDLARRFEKVQFLCFDPMPQDGTPSLARFTREHRLPFPLIKDPDGRIAEICRATRSPQVVVLDADRRVRYRGRIDDQYEPGKNRGQPTRSDLEEAIREVLAGRPVAVAETPAFGCVFPRRKTASAKPTITFHRDILPILQAHCQACHRPGEIAPFSLLTFTDARRWAAMIAEVTDNGRMPPWHANPMHGHFRNERKLTAAEKEALSEWADQGCPEGNPAEEPPAIVWPEGWAIGKPDLILRMPTAFHVPAEGVIEYQHVILDPAATTDLWVKAVEVRPGNRRVVHHCNVYLHPPWADDAQQEYETVGTLGSHSLTAFTPATGPLQFPPGMAKRIPAGWKLHLVLHYAPIGTPAEDQTEIGLVLANADEVRKEVATKLILDEDLRIPPGAAAHRVEHAWQAESDCLLLSLFPHMHLRGKSFRYVAEYPDGSSEILLDVPAYDFNWQHRYELAEPKLLPAGTIVRAIAVYDNSADNPNNPDPSAEVRTGPQSWDEMFNGYFEIALADQDLQSGQRQPRPSYWPFGGAIGICLVALVWQRRKTWR